MTWEILSAAQRRRNCPYLSIDIWGNVRWSLVLQEKMGNPEYVQVLYDKERNRFGIRPIKAEEIGTYKVGRSSRIGFRIAPRSPLKAYGLIPKDRVYAQTPQFEDNIIFIGLEGLLSKDEYVEGGEE